MKKPRFRFGIIVYIQSKTDRYDYILRPQDIIDIKRGEWDEVGLKLIDCPPWKVFLIDVSYVWFSIWNR